MRIIFYSKNGFSNILKDINIKNSYSTKIKFQNHLILYLKSGREEIVTYAMLKYEKFIINEETLLSGKNYPDD